MRKIAFGVFVALLVVAFTPTTAQALPQTQCFQNLAANMEACSELGTWWARSLCGGDAELEFIGCVGQEISPWK